MSRRNDIDQLRGVAILLMVMVHSAATWAPSDASTTSILALIIGGLGGLAAPLFVTVGGWVTVQSKWTLRKALIRFAFLYVAQILVNLSAPQRFDTFSPGVLTLIRSTLSNGSIMGPNKSEYTGNNSGWSWHSYSESYTSFRT
ncbi:MAG: DUF1624 domain-containing protein [Candidatus Poseidoniales archaeon]|nr:MAG: DUF1624 domain-containing protein [Candidatus Poseidoniales archaeon]